MGLFHSHPAQPNDQGPLRGQLQQAALPYEGVIITALQWTAAWALPSCQIGRIDNDGAGYQWQLWHTREDGTTFVDVTAEVFFEDHHPDKPKMFLVTYQTPGGWSHRVDCPLVREDLYYALRRAVASH